MKMSSNISKIEFAVKITGPDCGEKIKECLQGLGNLDLDEDSGRLIIQTTTPWLEIQEKIEKTGRRAVLSGYGNQSAVAIINKGNERIKGIVRFSAIDKNPSGCIIDGVVDGLEPGLHGIHVYECGDVSNGCLSIGSHYDPLNTQKHGGPEAGSTERHAGDLGNITANENGRAIFRFIDSDLPVNEIIGRAVGITTNADDLGKGVNEQSLCDGNSGQKLACGIIARSAGMFQNYKKLCACDGRTLWDERDIQIGEQANHDNNTNNNNNPLKS